MWCGLYKCGILWHEYDVQSCAAATAESSSDGRGDPVWQQAGRHQTLCGKYADENSQ